MSFGVKYQKLGFDESHAEPRTLLLNNKEVLYRSALT